MNNSRISFPYILAFAVLLLLGSVSLAQNNNVSIDSYDTVLGFDREDSTSVVYDIDSVVTPEPPKVVFYEESYDWTEFKELARDINMPYFLDFTASWCPPCKLMDELVFEDSTVALFANDRIMAYKVHADYFTGMDLAEKYDVRTYPTVLFFTAGGQLLGRINGLYTAEGFLEVLKNYRF